MQCILRRLHIHQMSIVVTSVGLWEMFVSSFILDCIFKYAGVLYYQKKIILFMKEKHKATQANNSSLPGGLGR